MIIKPEMWGDIYRYLVYDRKQDDSRNNVQKRESTYRLLCKYFSDKDFTRDNFTRFIQYLIEKGYSKEYANTFIKLAKHIDRYYQLNELEDFRLFPRTPKMINWLSYEEILKMANVEVHYDARWDSRELNLKYKCLIMVLLMTGARISEVLNLRWENLKDNPHCIVIEENKINNFRVSPISSELYNMIQSLPHRSGYIFTGKTGKKLDDTTINTELKRRAALVGVKKRVYNHLLRHSFVNFMLRQGTPMYIVSRLVGHRDIATTNEYYTHIMIEELSDFLHTYHPHLRQGQTLGIIKKRMYNFLESFLNKDKFKIQVSEHKREVNIEIKEL